MYLMLQNIKLSAIKVDSKFTTTTQIVKLVGSHNIAKVNIRISDLKRTKMVRIFRSPYKMPNPTELFGLILVLLYSKKIT